MPVFRIVNSIFRRRQLKTSIQLRELTHDRRYGDVIEAYENGKIATGEFVSDILGYCYYQLSIFSEAIIHLRSAIEASPKDYYSRYFLAVSLKEAGRTQEAIEEFIECLRLHTDRTTEIFDQLLPLVERHQIRDERNKMFLRISEVTANLDLHSLDQAKLLFYHHDDQSITSSMLQGELLCPFYDAKQITAKGHGRYSSLGEQEKLRFVYLDGSTDSWIDTLPPYVAEIKNAIVTHNSSLVLVEDKFILSDLLAHRDYGRYVETRNHNNVLARRDDALIIKKPVVSGEIPEAVMLSGLASFAYGHWFAEFIPKLRFLEKHPRFHELPILVDEGMPKAHYEFLSIFVSNAIYEVSKGSSLRVENLLIAPTDVFFPIELIGNHPVPPERVSSLTIGALRFIRKRVVSRFGTTDTTHSRIFLSRRNSQWRRLTNEDDIIADLTQFGFTAVCVEDLPFEEQIKLFQSAECIVAPNGSALNNLIFADPSVKVLMLGQKNLFNWGGWFGSFKELGYTISYLAGDVVGSKDAKHSDYFIPALQVKIAVEKMIGEN